jgi:hypothetical protein
VSSFGGDSMSHTYPAECVSVIHVDEMVCQCQYTCHKFQEVCTFKDSKNNRKTLGNVLCLEAISWILDR